MTVLVLSPHRDDAAFSCGLLLLNLLTSGARLTIANVCTVSDYAPYLPEEVYDRVNQVTAVRAAEDAVFARRLAKDAAVDESSVVFLDLGWQDAPIRLGIENEQC